MGVILSYKPCISGEGADCAPVCNYKVVTAVVLAQNTPDGTGSYCPGIYACGSSPCSGLGGCDASCGVLGVQYDWVQSQLSLMMDDASFPWNNCMSAVYTTLSGSPAVSGPSPSACGYGGPSFGSGFATGTSVTAGQGPAIGGNLCGIVNMVALNMDGVLYLSPEDIFGSSGGGDPITTPCQASIFPSCTPKGMVARTTYIPMPPLDLCDNLTTPLCDGYQVQYYPEATGTCPTIGVTGGWSGGSELPCLQPDPFFGDDPP